MLDKYEKRRRVRAVDRALVSFGSIGATVLLFLLLPIINKIAGGEKTDTIVTPFDQIELEAEDDPVEEEQPEEEEEEEPEPEPELDESEPEPFDLSMLEQAVNAEVAGAAFGGDFTIDLSRITGKGGGGVDELFSAAELDGKPQATSQPPPSLSKAEKKATPGKVFVIFIVDKSGRVQSPKVQKSSSPALNPAAIRTVKKWRFKPGTRKGEPVSFRMRAPITFPKQQ